MPWAALGASLAYNYIRHRRQRPTICSIARSRLPKPVLLAGYTAGAVSLGVHVARGYRAITD